MASVSRDTDVEPLVLAWLEGQLHFVDTLGSITVHVDELLGLEVGDPHLVDTSYAAFSALIDCGETVAEHSRLLLSFPLADRDDAVPFAPSRLSTIWSELDPYEPPSLSVVDLRWELPRFFDDEEYSHPLDSDRTPTPEAGKIATNYVATRSRLYRDNGWNFSAAILVEYFPVARFPKLVSP